MAGATLDMPQNCLGDSTLRSRRTSGGLALICYSTLGDRWAFGARAEYDWFELDDDPLGQDDPAKVRDLAFPLTARWFHPNGLFAEGQCHVPQSATRAR